jgi:hypothetical protein
MGECTIVKAGQVEVRTGAGKHSGLAKQLVYWAVELNDLAKAKRILSVAQRIEQRYRLAHGLPNMGV